MSQSNQWIHFILRFVSRQKGRFLTICLLDGIAWPLDVVLWPYILSRVVDLFTQFDTNRPAAMQTLSSLIVAGICLAFFVEAISRTMGFLMAKATPQLSADIRLEMFEHIQHHSPRYFNERFAGGLANQISEMTTHTDTIIRQLFWPLWPAVIAIVVSSAIFWAVEPLFGAIWIGWILLHFGLLIACTRSVATYEHRHSAAKSTLQGKIVDSLTNNFSVNLFFRFKHETKQLLPFHKEEETTNIKAKWYGEKMYSWFSVLFLLCNFLLLNGALVYFWLHNQITTGQVVQVFNTAWSMTGLMWMIGSSLPQFFQAVGGAKQAYTTMLDPTDLGDVPNAQTLRVEGGSIIFENVSFSYGEEKLFENKHVHIRAGEKVGLVGFTGSGKSTFVNLILRFFPLRHGKILIDGQDIAKVSLESLRRHIALIPQDPILFHRSLKDNISYGKPDATDEEMLHAAQLAFCDDFIRKMSHQYETKVGERGAKLSGGEKQRIAIARAILVSSPILILDEATSALDTVTERYIQNSLATLMKGKTSIVIAHRLSTLSQMDRILVFDHGKIVEEGSHEALIQKKGLYAKMWNMQVNGFLPS